MISNFIGIFVMDYSVFYILKLLFLKALFFPSAPRTARNPAATGNLHPPVFSTDPGSFSGVRFTVLSALRGAECYSAAPQLQLVPNWNLTSNHPFHSDIPHHCRSTVSLHRKNPSPQPPIATATTAIHIS